jgi:hypothetical protein
MKSDMKKSYCETKNNSLVEAMINKSNIDSYRNANSFSNVPIVFPNIFPIYQQSRGRDILQIINEALEIVNELEEVRQYRKEEEERCN